MSARKHSHPPHLKEERPKDSLRPVDNFDAPTANLLLQELHGRLAALEQENASLRQALKASKGAHDQFIELYDFAPVGCLSLTAQGLIVNINRTCATLLGQPRELLLQQTFSSLVRAEDAYFWDLHFLCVLKQEKKLDCELALRRSDGTCFDVRLDCQRQSSAEQPTVIHVVVTDIAVQKRIEEVLREREHQLQTFIEHSPVALAMFDNEMRYLQASHRWLQDYGLDGSDLSGRSHYEVFPEISSHWKEIHRRCLAGEVLRADDDRFERADGSVQWLRWEVRPWYDASNAIGGIIIFAEEITRRKFTEAELDRHRCHLEELIVARTEELAQAKDAAEAANRTLNQLLQTIGQRERFIRSITDAMPDLVAYWDRNLRCRFGNQAYLSWFGIDPLQMEGKHIREVIGEDRYKLNFPYIEGALRGELQEFERAIPSPDGKRIRYSLAKYMPDFRDGEVQGFSVLVTDISAQKQVESVLRQSEAVLRESEARYRSVVQDQTELISRLTSDGVYLFANDVFYRFFGLSEADLIGRHWYPIVYAEDLNRVKTEIGQLSAGNPVVIIENRVHAGDGRVHWMEFINRGIFDGSGRLIEIQSVGRDITKRKKAEALLAKYAERLKELSSHLQTIREAERTRVARELHDELGQVLTALKMDISFFRAATEVTDRTASRLESMSTLVDQAFDTIHRIASDLRPVMLDDLGLKAALEWLVEGFNQRYSGINCDCVFALDNYQPEGEIATAVYRVVQECLTNVVRHAEASKVHVVVARRFGKKLVVSVQDNGRGMQRQSARAEGFGLLGMRERVAALGGSFEVESMPGEGVSVDVVIPLPVPEVGGAEQ